MSETEPTMTPQDMRRAMDDEDQNRRLQEIMAMPDSDAKKAAGEQFMKENSPEWQAAQMQQALENQGVLKPRRSLLGSAKAILFALAGRRHK